MLSLAFKRFVVTAESRLSVVKTPGIEVAEYFVWWSCRCVVKKRKNKFVSEVVNRESEIKTSNTKGEGILEFSPISKRHFHHHLICVPSPSKKYFTTPVTNE